MASGEDPGRRNGHRRRSTVLKVLLLGDGGVGKSCLMNRFVRNQFDSQLTIGVEFLKKDLVLRGQTYTLQVWDTAGQERYRSLRTPFYRGTDVCLLTYSLDDRLSLDRLDGWMEEFRSHADVKDFRSFPFVLIGNKSDVPQDRRQVTSQDIKEWCAAQGGGHLPALEVSAKDATNVEQAFHLAVEAWVKMDSVASAAAKTPAECTVKLKKSPEALRCCVYTKKVVNADILT